MHHAIGGTAMYIKRLELQEYKCFEQATIDFRLSEGDRDSEERSQFTLIVGDNRSGKSAILKALAMGVTAPVLQGGGFRPFYLYRRLPKRRDRPDTPERGTIRTSFWLSDAESKIAIDTIERFLIEEEKPYILNISERESNVDIGFGIGFFQPAGISQETLSIFAPNLPAFVAKESMDDGQQVSDFIQARYSIIERFQNSQLFADSSQHFFVAGYHPSRRIELAEWNAAAINRQRGVRYQRLAGLFEEQVSLRPLTGWFQTLSKQRQQEVENLLASLLGGKAIRLTDAPRRDIYVDLGDGPLPFSVLSDGYRAFLAWTTDLIGQMCDVIPDTMALTDMTGIVLIDEIDAHLHPKWQRRVVQDVTRTFPNLQFIATTHSPLVAGTVHPENVLVTELQDDGTATVRRGTEALIGRSANEILLSSYFGLDSTRSGPVAEEITKLLRQATDGDQDAALKAMRLLAGRE